ncbi:zinc ribbon domain-containing protein [Rhodopseudomonas palustris]|uniref:Zn-ribbon domain-containing OB-fold protein n=1 Tax=Rhodopseudomonas palustris TaxID=1076 RepID=UPI002ACD2117|nr:zinc ribbon domain-containing protein [Rhodopseudomonas palustris]WQH00531.1 zinc ribbon domain-containing protein [Rhodopseudomonas palustris]
MSQRAPFYLPSGLPTPLPEPDGLSAPYWGGLRENRLLVQRCAECRTWQFGAEWICHHCHALDPDWVEVEPRGRIFSWERVWHPSHTALTGYGPYLAVLVELPQAGAVRMIGNLLGDPMQEFAFGEEVVGQFEHHADGTIPFTLLHWKRIS